MAGFGNMGKVIAHDLFLRTDLKLKGYFLEKEKEGVSNFEFLDKNWERETLTRVEFIPEHEHYNFLLINKSDIDIIVDFTLPVVVERNVDLYCDVGIPFVMGTTGGDRGALELAVKKSKISAVIAPNMAPQIVGFQAMMKFVAENFSGLFQDYELRIVESHQATKVDTSGTAKEMVRYFNPLGAKNGLGEEFEEKHIIKERDRGRQLAILGVDEDYLDGHAWHIYDLISPDRTTSFNFQHKVNGRQIYCNGVYQAINFLMRKIQEGSSGEVFSMIDVLKSNQR